MLINADRPQPGHLTGRSRSGRSGEGNWCQAVQCPQRNPELIATQIGPKMSHGRTGHRLVRQLQPWPAQRSIQPNQDRNLEAADRTVPPRLGPLHQQPLKPRHLTRQVALERLDPVDLDNHPGQMPTSPQRTPVGGNPAVQVRRPAQVEDASAAVPKSVHPRGQGEFPDRIRRHADPDTNSSLPETNSTTNSTTSGRRTRKPPPTLAATCSRSPGETRSPWWRSPAGSCRRRSAAAVPMRRPPSRWRRE